MTYNHIEMLQSMAKAIDKGYSRCEALQWSKLLYLPFAMLPEKDVSNKARSWIQLSEYEASVDEQIAKVNQIIIKKCHMLNCDLTFIDGWSHRWEYHPDSSNRFWGWHPDLFKSVEVKKQLTKL